MSDGDWFSKVFPDPEAWAAQFAATPVTGQSRVVPMDEPSAFSTADLTVRKVSAVVEVPDELLMVYGLIPDTRPKPPPLPWRWRMRNRIRDWRERTAHRAFKIIAGYEVPDQEDW